MKIPLRLRRLRSNPLIRELVAETQLSKEMLIYPYFLCSGRGEERSISSMPGLYRFSIDRLLIDVEKGLRYGVNKLMLFGTSKEKCLEGELACQKDSLVPEAIRALRQQFGHDLYITSDICLCPYTSHGHCGLLENGFIDNDRTLPILGQMALRHAEAGVDLIAPSDMMDGRVGYLRELLDRAGFSQICILSHAVKFASNYYACFRGAADSGVKVLGEDRKTYQIDFRNAHQAMREVALDIEEGADILLIKPALAYLDIIYQTRQTTDLPLACYSVSSEYAMVKTASASGLVDERGIVLENLYAFRRAGATIVISYHTRQILEEGWL